MSPESCAQLPLSPGQEPFPWFWREGGQYDISRLLLAFSGAQIKTFAQGQLTSAADFATISNSR